MQLAPYADGAHAVIVRGFKGIGAIGAPVMNKLFAAACLATSGLLAGLGLGPSATASVPSSTLYLSCYDSATGNLVPITDTITSYRETTSGLIIKTNLLTDPATGLSVTFKSVYRTYSDESGDYWTGPALLDDGEVEPGIYYLKGRATIYFSGGGYTGSFSAEKVVDVCASVFGYTTA